MELAALVALLIVIQYLAFTMLCGAARAKSSVQAPACSGDQAFECAFRIQQNTLEQLIIVLPSLLICAHFFSPMVAAICGAVFIVGRFMYRAAYISDPKKRGPGMIIGMLATVVMLGCGLWGVVSGLLYSAH